MSETKFGTWTAPDIRSAIEYSLVVIEEIRQAVAEGFQRFARGGIEVGGVLYGTYDGATVRILALREIACEHARGPSFVLSDKDLTALGEQLERDREDPRLEGFSALGWFVSHTRSDITLLPTDQQTFEAFFPEMWQVTLVVRPGRGGAMRAGFFVRETDGTIKTERSYQDFDFPNRAALSGDRPSRERPLGGDRIGNDRMPSDRRGAAREVLAPDSESGIPQQGELPFSAPPRSSGPMFGAPATAAPEYMPYPRSKRIWPWVVATMVVLSVAILAVASLRSFGARANAEPISLAVYERDSQLRIEWNHNAAPIRGAASGTLDIVDGKESRSVPLSATDLARGSFTYARTSGDVQVHLQVQNADGDKTQEASRFLGTPPRAADANELDTVQLERDALKDELTRLRTQNSEQAERIRQLERTLAIMRLRLGIVDPAKR